MEKPPLVARSEDGGLIYLNQRDTDRRTLAVEEDVFFSMRACKSKRLLVHTVLSVVRNVVVGLSSVLSRAASSGCISLDLKGSLKSESVFEPPTPI